MEVAPGQVNFRGSLTSSANYVLQPMLHLDLFSVLGYRNRFYVKQTQQMKILCCKDGSLVILCKFSEILGAVIIRKIIKS